MALASAMSVCMIYTVLFAVQFWFHTIPREAPLTTQQLLRDKWELLMHPSAYLAVAWEHRVQSNQ
jgi:hypothetical protein